MFKTKTSLVSELINHIKSQHPYEVPEITSTELTNGFPNYLKWIDDSTKE